MSESGGRNVLPGVKNEVLRLNINFLCGGDGGGGPSLLRQSVEASLLVLSSAVI